MFDVLCSIYVSLFQNDLMEWKASI